MRRPLGLKTGSEALLEPSVRARRSLAVGPDGVDPRAARAAGAVEDDAAPVRRERGVGVVGGAAGQRTDVAAVGVHQVDVRAAVGVHVAVAREGDQPAVGGDRRLAVLWVVGQLVRFLALARTVGEDPAARAGFGRSGARVDDRARAPGEARLRGRRRNDRGGQGKRRHQEMSGGSVSCGGSSSCGHRRYAAGTL